MKPTNENSRPYVRTALLTLFLTALISGCASQGTVVRRQPLNDQKAPPPEAFSKCLREIVAYSKYELDALSSECSTLLQGEQTK